MEVKWIEYKSKRILYVDYKGAKTPTEMIAILAKQEVEERKLPDLRILTDFTGIFGSTEYMSKVKAYGKELRQNSKAKQAVMGITGMKQVLLNGYLAFTGDKTIKPFNTQAEALEWLIH